MNRIELAREVAKYHNKYDHFLLDYFPRVGKSVTACELCNEWLKSSDIKILILTNSTTTNNQWLRNLEEHNPHLVSKTDIYCYQSLHKIENIYDVIMLDEAELSFTENRSSYIKELKPKHWIGMSGTWTLDSKNFFRDLTGNKHYTKIVTLEQAVSWGILPQPNVIKAEFDLDDQRRYMTFEMKGKGKGTTVVPYHSRWSAYNTHGKIVVQCTEKECNDLHDKEVKKWQEWMEDSQQPPSMRKFSLKIGFEVCKVNMLRKALNRKNFFTKVKTRYFKHLYNKILKGQPNARVLIFCGSIEQAEFINSEMSIHSKKIDSEELLNDFNNGVINSLLAVKILDRGVDLQGVDYAIIIQGDNSQNSVVQRAGRSLLSISPKIIIMCAKNTVDEKYVGKFLENFPPEWVTTKQIL